MEGITIGEVRLETLDQVAKEIVDFADHCDVWLFEGEMGAGKTTLIKAVCNVYGVQDNVSSPTFSIVNEYADQHENLYYHFDFYRIENEGEALDIGCEEYFYSGNKCFIEWSSKIKSLLPPNRVEISIATIDDNTRSIKLLKHE